MFYQKHFLKCEDIFSLEAILHQNKGTSICLVSWIFPLKLCRYLLSLANLCMMKAIIYVWGMERQASQQLSSSLAEALESFPAILLSLCFGGGLANIIANILLDQNF